MFIFNIYNSFDTEVHFRVQGDFYLLKTIFSFNSGQINMKSRIIIIISSLKTFLSPSEMQKYNRKVFVKKKCP